MDRVVDIAKDNLFVSVLRGFLVVQEGRQELGRVALDDIGAVIAHAHGLTWSNNTFVRLGERGVPVVLCAANHAPIAIVWPVEGHHAQGARMRAQLAAPRPLSKQLWRQIVCAKIRMQGRVLELKGERAGAFDSLARKVRSGDPENVEAQAARRYWKLLFGPDFTRDRHAPGANGLLNYGYTVLRALVSRAICAAGLHPTVGIFHANRNNAFALADDLMEPYRPIVDHVVSRLVASGALDVTADAKKALAEIVTVDLQQGDFVSPLGQHINRLVHSLALSFENGRPDLLLPDRLVPVAEPDRETLEVS